MASNKTLFRNAIVAALGGMLFGFDTAVISGTTDALKAVYNLSSQSLGFTVASALIGTILGAAFVGKPADRFGRRALLVVMAVFYFVSAVGCGFAWNWYSLLFFRFLGGLAVGGSSVVSPLYIAEIAPARIRGRLVALAQFNIVLGILLAFLSNYIIATMHLGNTEWRWMFGIVAFPSAVFFFLLFGNFDSPRWLIARGRSDEAKAVLNCLGTDANDVDKEVQVIQESIHLESHLTGEPFYCAKYFKPISLAVMIAMFNQLSGINAILYYAPTVFKMAGAASESAMLQSALIGLTNLVFTMFALAIIDHFGRKKLMLVGSIGYIISLTAAAVAFFHFGTSFTPLGGKIVLGAIVLFIAAHAFGQGAVIWVFISEIFPNRVRARGQALGAFTHWIMAAAISWSFPFIADKLGAGYVFAFYAVMMGFQLVWVLFSMPETKGVALEDIQKTMGIE
jgi:sugar porter (SP) family MFS transporter